MSVSQGAHKVRSSEEDPASLHAPDGAFEREQRMDGAHDTV